MSEQEFRYRQARKYAARNAKRVARERGAVFWETVHRDVIYLRDAGRCRLCGDRVLLFAASAHPRRMTMDHIIPVSQGGRHTYANIQSSCNPCNQTKGDDSQWNPPSTSGWPSHGSRSCRDTLELRQTFPPTVSATLRPPCFCLFT